MNFVPSILCVMNMVLLLSRAAGGLGNTTDQLALLAIKEQIPGDPLGFFRSWNDTNHFCDWSGIMCGQRHRRVTVLNLSSSGLLGTLSPEIGNLTFLRKMDLRNNGFHGVLPQEIGRLSRLTALMLRYNSFWGELPANLTRCTQLTLLDLFNNNFTGKIPAELGHLMKLKVLKLSQNSHSGTIPASLGNISSLQQLYLGINFLAGSIPSELGSIPKLQELSVPLNNLSGTVPPSLYNVSSMSVFSLAENHFTGHIPPELGTQFPNLTEIYLGGNEFSGPLPLTLPNASELINIDLAFNRFSGSIPENLGQLQYLEQLNLGNNSLRSNKGDDLGFLPSLSNCSSLQRLWIFQNNLTGFLPPSVANLSTRLSSLELDENYISGSIHPGIGNLVSLQHLKLAGNLLTGVIPESLGQLSQLCELFLWGNFLSGNIPESFGNITQLGILALHRNALEGSIPSSLRNCTLQHLILSWNRLTGIIPGPITSIESITILFLSNNHLSGPLPSTLGGLKYLWQFGAHHNNLSGEIPATLGDCLELETIYLAHNKLEGTIPSSVGHLGSLQLLDLSGNNLVGQIPPSLEKFSANGYLNLSYNDLQGEVPMKGIFTNSNAFSVLGNDRLCGGVEALRLPPCPREVLKGRRINRHRLVAVVISAVSSSAFLLCIWIWVRRIKRRPPSESPSSRTLPLPHPKVSYATLHKATAGFSEESLIGEGSFGSVYKGTLHDNGETVAVKVLKTQKGGASKNFLAECEALRLIRHRNLVKVITTCSSIDHAGNEFKALVFEYMPNGSLEKWLHPSSHDPRILNLKQRLGIVTDVADAIHYMHCLSHTPIIHCDLKPSNVLLDEDFHGHVSDFGLAKILSPSEVISTSLGIRGTIGYVAPEYSQGSEPSIRGDVYSYGILLLETFTGKRPTDSAFVDNNNLQSYVKQALPDRVKHIADPFLGLTSDNGNSHRSNGGFEELLASVLQIGLACSSESPGERPDMGDVCRELHSLMRAISERLAHRVNYRW